jgi:signal transduction histidine kinase/ActR/RegA family two-component response regulator
MYMRVLHICLASRHDLWQDNPSVAVRAIARKATFLDAHIQIFERGNFWTAWLWHDGSSNFVGVHQASHALLALTCLWICVVIFRSYFPWHRPRDVPSRGNIYTLGVVLFFCGASQLVSALVMLPIYRLTVMSLLASMTCWAAVLALVPLLARMQITGDVKDYEREIAERQRAEAALLNSEAVARKLAEADARKNEFLAMLGHELRNPLAPIRNAVKVMKQLGSNDPDLCWARDVVDHQVRQMAQLVDDLLEISRVTSGKVRLQKEAVDIATIVAFATETSRPVLEAHHHRLSIALPSNTVHVDADPIRMAQVLSNLLNNAAKYTKPGGQIRLAAAREGVEVVFRVKDNGIGIPHEMLSGIFDLFAQVDHSLDHSQGGLGLGLTLVRSLVEMHGGSVQALSEGLSRGSEFIVRLPVLNQTHAQLEAPKSAPEKIADRKEQSRGPVLRVLVVDDNVSSAQSLAKVLKLDGHEVQVAHDGGSAIEAVQRFSPEVVLMDIGLPGIDGYEVARRLRHDAELARRIALLVAVTGYAEDNARRRSHEAGFDHHLVKPVDPDEVLALLASLEWCDQNREFSAFVPASPQPEGTLPTSAPADPAGAPSPASRHLPRRG